MPQNNTIIHIYEKLLRTYGSQSWWPANSSFEVMIGTILTQNTAWFNVEKAIAGLRKACELTPASILSLTSYRLEEAIRPSGYYRQKADRLRGYCRYLMGTYGGDVSRMKDVETVILRDELLALKGIGPETADSILLYALNRPVFVIDAYTIRFLSRLGLCEEKVKYDDLQSLFMDNLEPDALIFNEYHALIVKHGKQKCTKRTPECNSCVLNNICTFADSRFQISDSR